MNIRSIACAIAALLLLPSAAFAEGPHRGHWSISYQHIKVDGFESSIGELDIGTTDTHTLHFEVDYQLTERIALVAGIPLVRKKYEGGGPHVPTSINPPQDDKFIDDGDYHTEFQDFQFGVRYLLATDPLIVEPSAVGLILNPS